MMRGRSIVGIGGGWLAAWVLWAGPAPGQPAPAGSRSVADLSARFVFQERYGKGAEAGSGVAGEIAQYRVGVRDTIRTVTESPQGAPERQEVTNQAIYTERAAELDSQGKVLAVVRHYEAFRRTAGVATKPLEKQRPLEGLTVWYKLRDSEAPLVLSLSQGRRLRLDEYRSVRSELFLPELSLLLPETPVRVGDRWDVSRVGAAVLLGLVPLGKEPLRASLLEVRQAAKGKNWEAVIGISGQSRLSAGDTAVNARLVFSFAPPAGGAGPGSGDAPLRPYGAVTELRMATSSVVPQAPNSRLRQVLTRELTLGRQLEDPGAALGVPASPPAETEENSWLTYEDDEGKFHFRYPQEFQAPREADEFAVLLFRNRLPGGDQLELRVVPKTGDPEADRMNRDPDTAVKEARAEWQESGFTVIAGPRKWLPDADWTPFKKKVFRAELAAVRKSTRGKADLRLHIDVYLVLFTQDQGLVVRSATAQESPTAYRQQIEAVIKTFEFGPSQAGLAVPPASAPPASAPPAQ